MSESHAQADTGVLDDFEQEYRTGILRAEEAPPAAIGTAADLAMGAVPTTAFAVRGCILTPERKIEGGYVLVDSTSIAAVGAQRPEQVPVIETGGVILPGLIDLHGHPEYNVFAPWEPPTQYSNRYAWRDSPEYAQVIKQPWSQLKTIKGTLARYAEVRALVSGVTAIQGASLQYAGKGEALVRNVDLRIFGEHRARSIIDLSSVGDDDRRRLRAQIDAGEVTALYVHLAEGVDAKSSRELDDLIAADLLTPATIIIHGTALSRDQLGEVRDAGARLVWSPQSNLRLYGRTTLAGDALELGIPLGLGADWLPSGSANLLAELKVARRTLALQGHPMSARRLVSMVTRDAARIAGLDRYLGRIEPGRPADLLVLERRRDSPWESVVEADASWVELVTIGGNLVYGRTDWIGSLAAGAELEPVIAWGKPLSIDTTYTAGPAAAPPPRLADLRRALIARYPQVGPIFA
ncbi:MAG TPA: amidohydrolase family protein [Thermomicrobiaceae bacterium]|nr:amidohydrolase family protein [Thermomicrobiaceae bacterium]